MHPALARIRSVLRHGPRPVDEACDDEGNVCSWDAMRAVYEEQAVQGVPEAVRGLELIEQDRWPSSGRPRGR